MLKFNAEDERIIKLESEKLLNKINSLDDCKPQDTYDAFNFYSQFIYDLSDRDDSLGYKIRNALQKATFGVCEDDIGKFATVKDLEIGDKVEFKFY